MLTARLLRTTTFRLALLYMVLFCASALVLLAFIYWTTVRVIDRETNAIIEAEIRGLAEQYRTRGLSRLVTVIEERSEEFGDPDSAYLLVDAGFNRLAGNVSAWPQEATAAGDGGWVSISVEHAEEGDDRNIRARTFLLPGDFRLLVGRDPRGRTDFQAVIYESLGWAMAITVGLGIAGGLFLGRNMLRRVEAVRSTSQRIMRGDLSQRMPVGTADDEFDRLSLTLNEMLDAIERLMSGMRTVTDSVAHDLRSPLTRLKSRLELALIDREKTAGEYRHALEEAIEETDGILRTFSALMEIARAEAGAAQLEMEPVNLEAVVADILELYQPVAEEKGITLTDQVAPGLSIEGHKPFLSQMLANLLDNAIKYTPFGGQVALSLSRIGRQAVLRVDDSGPGVPEAERERVLERFVRLEASRTSPGSGLGLSLVAGVATLHGATLTLRFLDTYRTMCIAPSSDFRQVLEDVRELNLAA